MQLLVLHEAVNYGREYLTRSKAEYASVYQVTMHFVVLSCEHTGRCVSWLQLVDFGIDCQDIHVHIYVHMIASIIMIMWWTRILTFQSARLLRVFIICT